MANTNKPSDLILSTRTPASYPYWYQRVFGLKYLADIRSIILVLLSLFFIYFPQFYHLPIYVAVVWIWVSSWLCTMAALVNHNHQHCTVFTHNPLNWILDLLITLCIGYASYDIRVPHNENHHSHHGNQNDWTGVHVAGSGYGWIRLSRYLYKATSVMKREISKQIKANKLKYAKLQRKIIIERIFLYVLVAFLLWHDWMGFVFFMLIPCLLAAKKLIEYNHMLHDGCELDQIETCSYSFVGKLENWLFLNIGYHTVHHLQPRLHWSLLPKLHQDTKYKIPDQYIRSSMVVFYFQYLCSYKEAQDESNH